ncbi:MULTISPECIES: dioxygenase [unclassified Beijerinckia]|uniref:dioxygenase family protein n=1 Tax=unclassified Beijerinckia TaxID=2638183 RepID=UPI00089B9B44|nr:MULTISPECIES: dioxygenase [unclassified Beijerinckia]MDH7797337.1 catechol 1,2-dioxygenase [Beijerinckia sp. GAS462]SEC81559.1 catechol 1,2-dioxygenase [Beijerinckia sp. 28-YEA-48]
MIIRDHQHLTETALAVMEKTPDPRLREIMVALVKHLHSFVREVKLTEPEFQSALAIINSIGQQSSDTHNEASVLAGSLGVSPLVCLLNNGNNGTTETTANLLGPFWRMNAPRVENGGTLLRSETPGPTMLVHGYVKDPQGNPIAGADADIWHSSPVGLYEQQDPEQAEWNLRGMFKTDQDGRFWFRSVKPAGYPLPVGGVVGDLLRAQKRQHYRPAHLHVMIVKPGFKTLISQVYVNDDPLLDNDPQFGVTRALVGDYVRHDDAPPAKDVETPWYSLDFNFTIEPGESKLPRPPIK